MLKTDYLLCQRGAPTKSSSLQIDLHFFPLFVLINSPGGTDVSGPVGYSHIQNTPEVVWRKSPNSCESAGLSIPLHGRVGTGVVLPRFEGEHPPFMNVRISVCTNKYTKQTLAPCQNSLFHRKKHLACGSRSCAA